MKKHTRLIIIAILVILLTGAGTFVSRTSYKTIPDGTIGNTAGNLYNKGLFCEYDGKVYFSNAYDNGALYQMNPDCTDLKRLTASSAEFINAGGSYLFYYMQSGTGGTGLGYVRAMSGVFRCNLKGKNSVCLNNDMATMMLLTNNTLYYQHYDNTNFSSFNKLAADKSSEEVLSDDIIEAASCDNGLIYYSGNTNDHYLYSLNPANDSVGVVWQGDLCYPTVIGDYVYYMDIQNDYRLCRYSLSQEQIEVLTNDRVDFYNIYGDVIFYQRSSETDPALIRISIDGSNPEVVSEGIYNRINTTSVYTYFYPYNSDDVVYRTSTTGAVQVTSFDEALEAAVSNPQ